MVFRTGALKLNYLYSITVEAYMARIKEWGRTYPGCLDLIYQADMRARKEYAGILKAAAMEAKARAIEHNQYHPLDETMPWDYVYTQLAFGEDPWWERTLIRYCSMVATGSGTVSQYLSGDVLTPSRPGFLDPPLRAPAKRAGSSNDTYEPPPPLPKHVITYDTVDEDEPPFEAKRRGKRPCPWFNGDGCGKALKDGACPKSKATVRQCSWYRSAGHGMQGCPVYLAIKTKGKDNGGRGNGRGER